MKFFRKKYLFKPKGRTINLRKSNNRSLIKNFGAFEWAGLAITLLYFYLINDKLSQSIADQPLNSISEISSFLSGIFAPVAFLWLVVGTISNSYHQKKSFQWLEEEKKQEVIGTQPIFTFKDVYLIEKKHRFGEHHSKNNSIAFIIKNLSEPAILIDIEINGLFKNGEIEELKQGESEQIILDFESQGKYDDLNIFSRIEMRGENNYVTINLKIYYLDKKNIKRSKNYVARFLVSDKNHGIHPMTIKEVSVPFWVDFIHGN